MTKGKAALKAMSHGDILDNFYTRECAACGHRKTAGVSFCPRCIKKLSLEMWRSLQVDNSKGNDVFDTNFRVALEHLRGLKKQASPRSAACA